MVVISNSSKGNKVDKKIQTTYQNWEIIWNMYPDLFYFDKVYSSINILGLFQSLKRNTSDNSYKTISTYLHNNVFFSTKENIFEQKLY